MIKLLFDRDINIKYTIIHDNMKKVFLIILLFIFSLPMSFAARGFAAKLYNENNVHFMNILVDYDYNKIRIQSNQPDLDFVIITRISNLEKTVLYINAVPISLYNNGNYDANNAETFIFDTKQFLFSTSESNNQLRFEVYNLEKNIE